ncbi:MAG: DUF1330 domain-containing protein [Pseudoruegeria sp.]
MPKGYWIAHMDVKDPDAYESYRSAVVLPLSKFGGRFIIRAGTSEIREGKQRNRSVVIEFGSYETALACYDSPEYQAVRSLRLNAADGDLMIIEGSGA